MANEDMNILKSEIKALYTYVNRNTFNLVVVKKMLEELLETVKGLEPPTIKEWLENEEMDS